MTPLDTDTPVPHFAHCHEGILAQLHRLSDLPALLPPAALARQTAQQSFAFFQDVMFVHHLEEEKDLFPAVQASAVKGEEQPVPVQARNSCSPVDAVLLLMALARSVMIVARVV